jgi:hypothetical protein
VRRAQGLDLDLDVVAVLQAGDELVHVARAHRPEHDLVGLRVVLEPHRDVLGHDPLQGAAELVLVALGLRVDGHGQQRLGQDPGLDERRVVLPGQRVRGLGLADLGDERDVTGHGEGLGAHLVDDWRRQGPDPLVVAVVVAVSLECAPDELAEVARDVDGLVGSERAGEDPHQGEPADVGIGRRADHLGNERTVRVACDGAEVRADGRVDRGDPRLDRGGEGLLDEVEQRLDAHTHGCVGRQDGKEACGRDRGPQVRGDRLEVDVLAAEVALEQRLVLGLLDDRLDEGSPLPLDELGLVRRGLALRGLLAGVVPDDTAQQAGRPLDRPALQDRDLEWLGVAEGALAHGDGRVEVPPALFEPGHGHGTGHAEDLALAPQQAGRLVEPVDRRDHEDRGVRGAQAGPHLTDEVGVPGRVQEVDGAAIAGKRGRSETEGGLMALPRSASRHARGHQAVEEGGLPCTPRPHEDDIADLLWRGGVPHLAAVDCAAHGATLPPRAHRHKRPRALAACRRPRGCWRG